MEKEKAKMSVGAQVFWGKLIPGILWIGVGITGMFESILFAFLHMVLLIVVIVLAIILIRAKYEEQDEMSVYNLMKAKATTRDCMHIVFCVASFLAALGFGLLQTTGIEMSLPRIVARMFFVLMGMQDILTSIIFRKLEAE